MEFFKARTNIDFLGRTRLMVSISVVACAICRVCSRLPSSYITRSR